MITASTFFLRSAISCTTDWDPSVGIAAACLIDPVSKIGPGTGKADPFPRDQSAITAVERVREITFFGIGQKLREEDRCRYCREGGFAFLHCGEKVILVGCDKLSEGFALRFLCRRICGGYPESVDLARGVAQLVTQCRRRIIQKRTFQIKIGTMAIWQLHLAVDEFGHAGLHSARARSFRRNQAPDSRIDERPFSRAEIRWRVVG